MSRPNCFKCKHLKITWDQDWPYACRGLDFKSRKIPSLEVSGASGLPCQMFSPKVKTRTRKSDKNTVDKKI